MNNPMCDGSGPCADGEVRLLPLGKIPDDGNIILCQRCFDREISWRRARNFELGESYQYKLPMWTDCEVYAC